MYSIALTRETAEVIFEAEDLSRSDGHNKTLLLDVADFCLLLLLQIWHPWLVARPHARILCTQSMHAVYARTHAVNASKTRTGLQIIIITVTFSIIKPCISISHPCIHARTHTGSESTGNAVQYSRGGSGDRSMTTIVKYSYSSVNHTVYNAGGRDAETY